MPALKTTTGTLPVNIRFLVEGEEEIGGSSIAKYVAENPDKLAADVALVSDTAMYAEGMPTLCIGLRGLVYMEVEAAGPKRDLHSCLYGGASPNAVFGLIELLAKAKNADGVLQIPGIYNDVDEPAAAEIASWRSLPFQESEFLAKEVGSTQLTGEPTRMVLERVCPRSFCPRSARSQPVIWVRADSWPNCSSASLPAQTPFPAPPLSTQSPRSCIPTAGVAAA